MTFNSSNSSASADQTSSSARHDGRVICVLGPTNTGKTHFAIERMLSHSSGMIGLPLRLLAREVYQKIAAKAGADAVALITGEEKIKPPRPRYWVATVEAMPRDLNLSFVAVDEAQLAADLDRGHVFCDRILNRRGRDETLIIGAATIGPLLRTLLPGAPQVDRPRLSKLAYVGHRKLARLPPRSAIVAFSAEEVYAIAEWIRRQKGGAAVVLGALSPRTRNAQIDMFQAGEVDYVVATDAIGMGLNLDVETVAFAADVKFDGHMRRRLRLSEFGQIAGRAGRHLKDGFFATSGRCPSLSPQEIESLEDHRFEPERVLQWRNAELDFSSPRDLSRTLDKTPDRPCLTRAPIATDQMTLEMLAKQPDILRQAATPADVARLWEACQIPDYRKISPAAHAELAARVFFSIVRRGVIAEDWFAAQINGVDHVDGDIDTLSQRIARVRTWSFISNRSDWLRDPAHWQERARRIEDRLSDALHDKLAQRFVDRRTSLLRRRLRENAMLEAEITSEGEVLVEGQHVGQLRGFRFTPDPTAEGEAAKALNAAAQQALAREIEQKATRVSDAVDSAFALSNDGAVRWLGEPIAKIAAGDKLLAPVGRVVADDLLMGESLEKVQRRVDLWLAQHVAKLLGALNAFELGEGLEGLPRGLAFRLAEDLGVVDRSRIAQDVKNLTQDGRAVLRKMGVRFGAYHVYVPALLKPAPRALAAQLWALKNGGLDDVKGLEEVAHLASSGRTSFAADAAASRDLHRVAGFKLCGERAVRVDILERLADLIRPAIAYRPGVTPGEPPSGAADGASFVVTVQMTSLAGCSGEAFASILRALGFASEQRPGPAITVPLLPSAPMQPIVPAAETEANAASSEAPQAGDSQAGESQVSDSQAAESDGASVETAQAAQENAQTDSPIAAPIATEAADQQSAHERETPAPEPAAQISEPAAQISEPAAPAPEPAAQTSEPAALGEPPTDSEAASTHVEAAGEPAAPAPMIEVWSPKRQQRPQHHHRNADQRRPPHQKNQRRREPSQGEGVTIAAQGEPQKPHQDRSQEQRPAPAIRKRDDGKKRFENKFEGKRSEQPRGGDQKRHFTPNPSRERKPDPNSPFAKLLALKAELEKKK